MPRLQSGAMTMNARVVDPVTGRAGYGLVRVDTGDDIALMSPSLLQTIGAVPVSSTEVEGIDGKPLSVQKYQVDIDLGGDGYLVNVEVLGLGLASLGYAGLFGDNELDQGILIRNGPARTWTFTASGPIAPPANPFPIAAAITGVGGLAILTAALWPRQRR